MKFPAYVVAYATISAALLSSCSANPEPAPQVPEPPSQGSSQAFLDQWERDLTRPALDQNAPKTWVDLMLPPGTDLKDHHK